MIVNLQSLFLAAPWASRPPPEGGLRAVHGPFAVRLLLLLAAGSACVSGGCGSDEPRAFSPVEYQRPQVIPWPSASIGQAVPPALSSGQVGESVLGGGGGESGTKTATLSNQLEVDGGHSPEGGQGGGAGALSGYTASAGGVVFPSAATPETP